MKIKHYFSSFFAMEVGPSKRKAVDKSLTAKYNYIATNRDAKVVQW